MTNAALQYLPYFACVATPPERLNKGHATWHQAPLHHSQQHHYAANWNDHCDSPSTHRPPTLALAWPFSGLGFYLVSWWGDFYGPPVLRVCTSNTPDCKVDGAHMQPGKLHPAGAKWYFNTWHTSWVSGSPPRQWVPTWDRLVEGHEEAKKPESE